MKAIHIALSLTLFTLFAIAGCSKSEAPANKDSAAQVESVAAQAETAKPADDNTIAPAEDTGSAKTDDAAKDAVAQPKVDEAIHDTLEPAIVKEIHIHNDSETIDARYPTVARSYLHPDLNIDAINAIIQKQFDDIIEEERSNFKKDKDPGDQLSLTLESEAIQWHYNAIDILIRLDRMVTNAAHPTGDVYTLMIDPKTATRITLADLVDASTVSADYLSSETRRLLPGIIKEVVGVDITLDDIEAETSPDLEHFKRILRVENGYRVYFPHGALLGPFNDIISVDINKKNREK